MSGSRPSSRRFVGGLALAFAALVMLAGSRTALAADPQIRAEVNARKLGVEDELILTVTLSGSLTGREEIVPPDVRNLDLEGPPSISTSIQIVNGAMSQSKIYTFRYRPRGVGYGDVGPIRAKVESGEKVVAGTAIEVVAGSILPRRRADPFGADPWGGQDPFEGFFERRRAGGGQRPPDPKIFITAEASRARVHVGEPLLVTWSLWTQASVTGLEFAEAPSWAGFWVEDLSGPKPGEVPKGERATGPDGEPYQKFDIFRKLVFPAKAGKLTIPATTIRLGIPRRSGSFFDPTPVVETVEKKTKPLEVVVDGLPDAPGFSGAVGRFRFSASLDRPTLPLGEAATLRVELSGTGNLKWLEKGPELAISGARVYPPTSKADLSTTESGISGTRRWEYVVVPETVGALDVPAIPFSWFDPSAGKLVTAESPALRIDVTPGGAGAAQALAPTSQPSARAAGTPMPLRDDLDADRPLLPPLSPRGLGGLLGVVVLAHTVLRWTGRRGGGGSARGIGSVRASLADIERARHDGTSKETAAALLEKALVDRFGSVDDEGAGSEGERAAAELLREIQYIRYAPQLGDYSAKLRELADRAEEVIRRWG